MALIRPSFVDRGFVEPPTTTVTDVEPPFPHSTCDSFLGGGGQQCLPYVVYHRENFR